MDRYTGFQPCPCCFESSGYMSKLVPASWTDPGYEDTDYTRRCDECNGRGMVPCVPRTLDDLEAEEWDADAAAWFASICALVNPPLAGVEAA